MTGPTRTETPAAKDHLCTECHTVGAPTTDFGLWLGGLTMLLGSIMAVNADGLKTGLGGLALVIVGSTALLRSRSGCPRCTSRAIIPIDTPRAQMLIRQTLREIDAAS